MGSIPLPALSIKPPEQPDILGQYGKMMSLKSMLGQQQIQQQNIQEGALTLKDQQTMRSLAPQFVTKDDSGKVTGYDTDGFAKAALSKGVSPQKVTALQLQQAQATKDFADAGSAKLKLEKDKNDTSYQVLEGVRSESDPQAKAQAYQGGLQKLSQMGIDVSKFPTDRVPSNDELTQMEIPLGMHGQAIADGFKIQETNQKQAQARMDNASAAMKEIEVKGLQALTPQNVSDRIDRVFDPKDPRQAGQNRMLKAMTLGALQQGDVQGAQGILKDGFQKAIQAASQIAVETDPRNVAAKVQIARNTAQARQDVTTGGYGQPGSPEVAQVGNGQVDLATALSRVPPAAKHTFLSSLNHDFPQYSQATYGTIKGVMKDFTSGNDAQKLQAFNTAITHMGVFRNLADELDNTDVRVVNQLGNAIGVQFGSDKSTNFSIAKKAFIGETARAFDGAGVTMTDRAEFNDQVSNASSPSQLKGAADTAERLLRGKRDVLQQQYDQGKKGQPNFQGGATDPNAKPWEKYPVHQ